MSDQIPIYTIESLKSSDTESKDFEFFRFEYFAEDIEHLKAPHRHHFYTFILVTDGGGSHSIDFHDHALIAGRLFLIAPGQVHAWIELKNVKGFVILFNDSFMALAKGGKIMTSWPIFRPYQQAYFDLNNYELKLWNDEFMFIEDEINRNDTFSRDAIFCSLTFLLINASRLSHRSMGDSVSGQDYLYSFQELIEENYLTLKTPKQYADKMNITANYLNAFCKNKTGISAGELIRQRIILEAKRLLAHTNLSMSEIAFKLDFQDNSYFGRFFKKYVNVTPGLFRESQKK